MKRFELITMQEIRDTGVLKLTKEGLIEILNKKGIFYQIVDDDEDCFCVRTNDYEFIDLFSFHCKRDDKEFVECVKKLGNKMASVPLAINVINDYTNELKRSKIKIIRQGNKEIVCL